VYQKMFDGRALHNPSGQLIWNVMQHYQQVYATVYHTNAAINEICFCPPTWPTIWYVTMGTSHVDRWSLTKPQHHV